MILAVWFLVSLAYYGVFVWVPAKLAAEGFGFVRGYGFLVLVALAQLPGYALAAYGVEKWGRKPTLIGFLLAERRGLPDVHLRGEPGDGRDGAAGDELRAARDLGRALRLHARTVPDGQARDRDGERGAPS